MKRFLLFLAVLFITPLQAANVTWRLGAGSLTVTAPPSPTGGGTIRARVLVNGANLSGAGVSSTIASGQTKTVSFGADSRTADETAAVRIVFYYDPNASGAPNVDLTWLQYDKNNNPPLNHGGPFDDEGNAVNDNGDKVDDYGDPIDPPQLHFAEAQYTNGNPFPVTIQITYNCTTEGLIYQKAMNLEPGAKWHEKGYHDHPFSITIQPMADGHPLGDPITDDSEPIDEDDPNHPHPDPGEPGGVGGPPSTGGGALPGDNQVPAPDPVGDEPRPGAGDGNDEARHKELKGELGRVVEMLRRGFNQAAGDADRTNDLLNSIKDNTGKTADNTEGIGDGDGGDGDGEGEEIGNGTAGAGEPADATDSLGLGDKLQGVLTAGSGTMSALSGLGQSLGLNVAYGTSPWVFDIPMASFGTAHIDFGVLPSWIFPTIRQILLAFMMYQFTLRYIKAFKGAFS